MRTFVNYFTYFIEAITETLVMVSYIFLSVVTSCAAIYVLWMFIYLILLRGEG